MKKLFLGMLVFSGLMVYSCNNKINEPVIVDKDTVPTIPIDPSYNIDINDFLMRDPFVFVDTISKKYYIHGNAANNKTIHVYESKDLKKWKLLGSSFTALPDFWGKQDFWAPDMFEYHGKYYMSVTFSAPGYKRGCSLLVSDSPEGTYQPLINGPITPKEWTCLDATIFIENDQPYLVYCREWLEVVDGEIYIQQLSADLKSTVGDPVLLFKASSAPWVGNISAYGVTGKVTDAPFIHKISDNQYIMLWSSFAKKNGKYSIGLARSNSLMGPWTQNSVPLNDDDGGHAMIFKSLDGATKISYHSPNTHPSYVSIYDLDIFQGEITIVK